MLLSHNYSAEQMNIPEDPALGSGSSQELMSADLSGSGAAILAGSLSKLVYTDEPAKRKPLPLARIRQCCRDTLSRFDQPPAL